MAFVVYISAGLFAGILTGLVGLSAAVVIAPMFATFLGMNPYVAIGIALASDVFASGVGSINYLKNREINFKRILILTSVVVLFTILASYLSYFTDPITLNSTINIFPFFLGLRFIVYPVTSKNPHPNKEYKKATKIIALFIAAGIGFISGFYGGGGGLSILALLTMLLKFDMKKAVGASLFMMTFTALVGAVAHIIIGGTFIVPLLITSVAAVVGSYVSSFFGGRMEEKLLSRIIGILLVINGTVLILMLFL